MKRQRGKSARKEGVLSDDFWLAYSSNEIEMGGKIKDQEELEFVVKALLALKECLPKFFVESERKKNATPNE